MDGDGGTDFELPSRREHAASLSNGIVAAFAFEGPETGQGASKTPRATPPWPAATQRSN